MKMSAQKWIKFNKNAEDLSEDCLERLYEKVQKNIDSGNMNPYDDLFRHGIQRLMGYEFFPVSEKFLYKLISETEIGYIVGYAKDKETCERILKEYYSEYDDFIGYQVIKYPFTI